MKKKPELMVHVPTTFTKGLLNSKKYLENYDKIFGKKKQKKETK